MLSPKPEDMRPTDTVTSILRVLIRQIPHIHTTVYMY